MSIELIASIISLFILFIIMFIVFCIGMHNKTDFDKYIDDEAQIQYLKEYNEKKGQI